MLPLLVIALTLQGALAHTTGNGNGNGWHGKPDPHGTCKTEQCCKKGYWCCGSQCIEDAVTDIVCTREFGGCCRNQGCASHEAPAPPDPVTCKPDDHVNCDAREENHCCAPGYFCCGESCLPNEQQALTLCILIADGCCNKHCNEAASDWPAGTPARSDKKTLDEALPPCSDADLDTDVVTPTSVDNDACQGCAPWWGQCGAGTCCAPGSTCEGDKDYKQCLPLKSSLGAGCGPFEGCAAAWCTCGGKGFTGPNCCTPGSICVKQSEYFSQCVPQCAILKGP